MTARIQVEDTEVIVEGEGSETILMIHGWPDNYRLWDKQVDALSAHYRCCRFTLPGFQKTDTRKAWSLDEMSERIRAVVTAISPDQPVIFQGGKTHYILR